MSNAPDRIAPYTHEAEEASEFGPGWINDPSCAGLYLLATPARQYAEELLSVLKKKWSEYGYFYGTSPQEAEEINALLAKIDNAS